MINFKDSTFGGIVNPFLDHTKKVFWKRKIMKELCNYILT